MNRTSFSVVRGLRASRGAANLEYAVLGGLLAVAPIAAVLALGGKTEAVFDRAVAALGQGEDAPRLSLAAASACGAFETRDVYDTGVQTKLRSNIWNPRGGEKVCIDHGGGMPTAAQPWEIYWTAPTPGDDVVAYPGAVFGQQVFLGYDPAPSAVRLDAMDVELSYDYALSTLSGRHNVAAETWILDAPVARPGHLVGEVMVWLETDGVVPAGSLAESGVAIGGGLYDLYIARGFGDASGAHAGSWDYFAFLRQGGAARAGTLSIDAFTDYLISRGDLSGTQYASSVEFGPEVVEGIGSMTIAGLSVTGLDGFGASDQAPAIAPFDFGTTRIAGHGTQTSVTSAYLDLGLGAEPRGFSVTADASGFDAAAISNVLGQPRAASGQILYGTALEAAMPDPGQTVTVTLEVDGVAGSWTIERAAPLAFATASDLGTVTAPEAGQARLAEIVLTDAETALAWLSRENGAVIEGDAIGGNGNLQLAADDGGDPMRRDLVCWWGPTCRGTWAFTITAHSQQTGDRATRTFTITVE